MFQVYHNKDTIVKLLLKSGGFLRVVAVFVIKKSIRFWAVFDSFCDSFLVLLHSLKHGHTEHKER